MTHNYKSIIENFKINGSYLDAEYYGSGLINYTVLVRTREKSAHDYVLRRLNHKVFRDIPKLMENIIRVTGHLHKKISKMPDSDPEREVLTPVHSVDGKYFHKDADGNFWHVYLYINDSKSYDITDSPGKICEAGRAFGRFQAMLVDLPGPPLHETIPGFHNLEKRLEMFRASVRGDTEGRVVKAEDEIKFVNARAEEMLEFVRLSRREGMPERITHNDTKINNVLFGRDDRALCVVDIDTVMEGYVHYDFGDAIRTSTNTSVEDEEDLDRVSINMTLFEAFAGGYIKETKSYLTEQEIDSLAFSARFMTYIMGVRFLTDYINRNDYFKIKNDSHNICRARAQFKLLESMEEQYDKMQGIIKKLAGN